MKEIRIHARAGQGAITTAVILGEAYTFENKYAFAFPHFGAARMGAPMNAFLRVDEKPITIRSQFMNPDYLIVVDSTLMEGCNIFENCKENVIAIVNSIEKISNSYKIYTIDANKIALEIMGRPIGNTVLLGVFAKITNEVKLESLIKAIERKFTGKIKEYNIKMIKIGYETI